MNESASKRCTKCGTVKPYGEFSPEPRNRDGRTSWCKACHRAYRAAHPARPTEAAREARREYNRRYHAANREAIREQQRRYREENRGLIREQQARYYEANREALLDDKRRYREENREALLDGNRRYRETVRAKVLAHYSPVSPPCCACCGSAKNLTIDHVNGGGSKHRLEVLGQAKVAGWVFYRWLVAQGFPAEPPLQVLCNRCNLSKHDGERCRLDHAA